MTVQRGCHGEVLAVLLIGGTWLRGRLCYWCFCVCVWELIKYCSAISKDVSVYVEGMGIKEWRKRSLVKGKINTNGIFA